VKERERNARRKHEINIKHGLTIPHRVAGEKLVGAFLMQSNVYLPQTGKMSHPACVNSVTYTSKKPQKRGMRPIGYVKSEEEKKALLKWKKIQVKVKKRDKYTCQKCKTRKRLTVHHIKSRVDGGKDHVRNLITLCERCHNEIEAMPNIKFWAWLKS
jgi:hypothetical protein